MPYGYTMSIWSAGALVMGVQGLPQPAEVFTFLAGSIAAFGLLALTVSHVAHRIDGVDRPADRLLAGILHWFAAGGAVGVAVLASQLPGWAAWGVSSFAVTCVYMLGASLQFAMVKWLRNRASGR